MRQSATIEKFQDPVIAFLGDKASYRPVPERVERLETHGAFVFLAGDEAFKIKRAVRFSYMDFSTLELRHRACMHELEINRPHAPELYLNVVPITRDADGHLAIGGAGEAIEWALHMRRFSQSDLLSAIVQQGNLEASLCQKVADAIESYHRMALAVPGTNSPNELAKVAWDSAAALLDTPPFAGSSDIVAIRKQTLDDIDRLAPLLMKRCHDGYVRRAHGDLHLENIVLWRGEPVLFDAIEFSDQIATIDTLYDLAFLLMDLDQRGQQASANGILNRYLWTSQDVGQLEGLAAMPLFLTLRACVRAMVMAQRAEQERGNSREAYLARARAYIEAAARYGTPVKPCLIVVGGLSGTGKSTLAAALAPGVGPASGAVHLRSDLERKAKFNCAATDRLPLDAYSVETGARVYAVLMAKAEVALRAGHSVIVDAVFSTPDERAAIEGLAHRLKVHFHGLWLKAPPSILRDRIARRRNDASDASVEIVDKQLAYDTGPITWPQLSASGDREATLQAAISILSSFASPTINH